MTKKYAGVYQPMIERLLKEEGKDVTKAAKRKLHQAYGAYTQENGHKKAAKLLDEAEKMFQGAHDCTSEIVQLSNALLALHTSTKERLQYYDEFFGFIYENTSMVESILDLGCGYNPFSVPLITGNKPHTYYAVDIDTRVAALINRFFSLLGLPANARCADLAVEKPQEPADIALMCKLVPVLEAQVPGSGFALASSLNTRYLLITYPLKSLGGREKGMSKNYTAAIEKAIENKQLEPFSVIAQKQVGQEMLYLALKTKSSM